MVLKWICEVLAIIMCQNTMFNYRTELKDMKKKNLNVRFFMFLDIKIRLIITNMSIVRYCIEYRRVDQK